MGRIAPQTYNLFLLVLAGLVAIGFFVVYRLRRDVEAEAGTVSDDDIFKELERAYHAGQMDEEEFRRVRAAHLARTSGRVIEPAPAPEERGGDPSGV